MRLWQSRSPGDRPPPAAATTMPLPDGIVERAVAWSASTSAKISVARAPHVCEVNVRSAENAVLCQRLGKHCEYTGLSFMDPVDPATSVQHGTLRAALQGHRLVEVLTPGAALHSARVLLDDGRALGASRSLRNACRMLVLQMDAPTASARQTLVTDLSAALEFATSHAPAVLVMAGRANCSSLQPYRNAFNTTLTEQCWREAWDKLVARRDITDPECMSKEGRTWCVGRLDSVSICMPNQPALLEAALDFSADLAARHPCKAERELVKFGGKRLLSPDWDVSWKSHLTERYKSSLAARNPKAMRPIRPFVSLAAKVMRSYRYYTLMRCKQKHRPGSSRRAELSQKDRLCLMFKNNADERFVARVASIDGGRSFGHDETPQLVLPMQTLNNSHLLPATLTHNLAIARLDGGERYALVGGRFLSDHWNHDRAAHPFGNGPPGVWMAFGTSLQWAPKAMPPPAYHGRGKYFIDRPHAKTQWGGFRMIFDGTHAGCVERRPRKLLRADGTSACEFDGRLSLVQHEGQLLLYARANLGLSGSRFVQMTRSADGGASWSPFSLLQIQHLTPMSGEIYFFAVQPNPIHNGSLIALAPIVHRFGGCIGLTLSDDGVHWSPLTPLVRCTVYGDRAAHHPVAGGLIKVRPNRLALFIQEDVPQIHFDERTPAELWEWHDKRRSARINKDYYASIRKDTIAMRMKSGKGRWRALSRHAVNETQGRGSIGASNIVRIEFGCDLLVQWTREALRALRGEGKEPPWHPLDHKARYSCGGSKHAPC